MWEYYWFYFYGMGTLFTLASVFFWQVSGGSKHWYKLLFGVSAGWLMVFILAGQTSDVGFTIFDTLVFMLAMPVIVFTGIQFSLYGRWK